MNMRMYDSKAYFSANDAFLKVRTPPREKTGGISIVRIHAMIPSSTHIRRRMSTVFTKANITWQRKLT